MEKTALNIEYLKNRLGLFPMPLFPKESRSKKYLLLNGNEAGNFCFDYTDFDEEQSRNYAWSSNVGHYLSLHKNSIRVSRWDRYETEKFRIDAVTPRINEFYNYLKTQELNSRDSIIKYTIQIYRQIRTLLRDDGGNDSLNALLYLFACVAENNIDRKKINISKWMLSENSTSVVNQISSAQWSELNEKLATGIVSKDLVPDINLFLRHASGSLFQEAHFETIFPQNYQYSLGIALPAVDKNSFGKSQNQTSAHFTPTSVVRTIVEEAINQFSFSKKKEITVLDPACGSGEFLKEFVRQARLKKYSGKINLIGWDISESAIDMARFIVNYEKKSHDGNISICIEHKDALLEMTKSPIAADFVLMNPPFISYELSNQESKEHVASILGDLNKQRPNLASAFLWYAINCLKSGGIIGSVLPTSIFENESYDSLRAEIKNKIDIKIIGRLGSQTLFTDTLVDTAIIVGKNEVAEKPSPIVFWSDYKAESASASLRELRKISDQDDVAIIDEKGYSLYSSPNLFSKKNWMPTPYKSYELLERFGGFPKVKDFFDIKQGVRTGMNAVFLVKKEYYEQLNKGERKYFRPAITNESIVNGALSDDYYIFYPAGDMQISSKAELIKVVPAYYKKYIYNNIDGLSRRARKSEEDFWKLSEHRAWQIIPTSKIVSTEFGSAGSFAFDATGIFVAERSHAWLPHKKNDISELGYAYLCILSMPIINEFLRGLSKQLGGGDWWYLSSKYINDMPLPDLFDDKRYNKNLILNLIDLGREISAGKNVEQEVLINYSRMVYNA